MEDSVWIAAVQSEPFVSTTSEVAELCCTIRISFPRSISSLLAAVSCFTTKYGVYPVLALQRRIFTLSCLARPNGRVSTDPSPVSAPVAFRISVLSGIRVILVQHWNICPTRVASPDPPAGHFDSHVLHKFLGSLKIVIVMRCRTSRTLRYRDRSL
jgi:hypothetical protein